jgi:hypothetical protein
VGRQVLRSSGLLVRLALIRPRWVRAVRNTVSRVLLGIPPVSERIAETISGIGVRYPAPPGASRDVGARAPNVVLRDGRRLHEVLRGGRFVLLGSGTAAVEPPPQVELAEQRDQVSDRWTLVRPDGYVGWAGAPDEFPAWADRYFGRRISRVASRRTAP